MPDSPSLVFPALGLTKNLRKIYKRQRYSYFLTKHWWPLMPVSARYRYLYLVLILVSTLSIIQTPALISINLLCVNNSHLNVLESIQQFIICVYIHHVLKKVWTNTVTFMNPMTKAIVKNYVNQTRNFFSLDLDTDPF